MRRVGLLAAALLVLAGVYLAARATGPGSAHGAQGASPQTVAVTSVTRSCPPPAPDTGAAHIAMVAVPPHAGTTAAGTAAGPAHAEGTGSATLGAVPLAARAAAGKGSGAGTGTAVSTPGALVSVAAPEAAQFGGTQVDATGQMAEGFEAELAASDGMGTVSCQHPGSDMWFVGTGQGAGASDIQLYLMNTGAMPASVEVTMLTDSGTVPGLSGGITVAAHHYLTESIAPLVKGSAAVALHVQTSSGQVAADVWEDGGSGGAWLPEAASPATQLVIPGLTAASSAARLFVAVPGQDDAQVKVTALTARGKFLPFGTTTVDAPAGAASSFPLSSLGASSSALVLTSSVPITAGVLVPGNGIGAFTTAAAPVTEQGVVAGNPAGGGLTVGLVLSAPGGAARASITVIPASNTERAIPSPQPRLLTIGAGHTVAVTVNPPKGSSGPFAIVVTPTRGSGPLYAARVVTSAGSLSGPVASLLPVPSALTQITLPPANDTYSAVLP